MEKSNLELIPKYERYIEYILNMILKLPRVEKYNIGNELKVVMYEMLENIVYLNKIGKMEKLKICNYIDAKILIQRIYIRLCRK
ncbi:MAG: four helix bundle protein [Clostridia bacterium]|nr:four helix bundle protein [Clostridia bacterium]